MVNRKWLIPILILIGVIAFSSHGLKGGPEVSVKDLSALMKSAPRPVIIDLRGEAEYRLGRIAGALSVPQAEFKQRLDGLKLSKSDALVLYGAHDADARASTKFLYENGYQGALSLKGGFEAWLAAGQTVEKQAP
jgi:rhodanese-related sulfurtransferase